LNEIEEIEEIPMKIRLKMIFQIKKINKKGREKKQF
jgi:hypothetical protein